MADITTFANDLLLDFLDDFHQGLHRVLSQEFGIQWLQEGVYRHLDQLYFPRVKAMLESPMRVVDMDKTDEELYGVEHLRNVVVGNWPLFKASFGDRARAEAYLSEITELRNNLAHRRKHQVLLRKDLVRFVQNCRMLLAALGSPRAAQFSEIENSLDSGGSPWGSPLPGVLPHQGDIYSEFVGRPDQLKELSDWYGSDNPQILVWGLGGAGKSALAYKFARDVRDGSVNELLAVCWVSAKRSEFVEGLARSRPADFNDLPSLIGAIWSAMYGQDGVPDTLDSKGLIEELNDIPILLVVDDFDTVSEDDRLAEFLIHDLRNTPTRVIYTSRRREILGIRRLEAPPFTDEELANFIALKAQEYGADEESCNRRRRAIGSVTDSYPLFVDDLIRHSTLIGIDKALQDWRQRRGDAAREFALRRQVEYLGQSSAEVLISLSIANKPLTIPELSDIAGLTDADTESSLRGLFDWRLANKVNREDTSEPAFRMNDNTRRLVEQTYRDDPRRSGFAAAFRSLSGERVPEAKRKAIANVIKRAIGLERHQGLEPAISFLQENMTGEMSDSPDLFGVLGRIYSKQSLECVAEARAAFHSSHRLGTTKTDMYFHWLSMEVRIAETLVSQARDGVILEGEVAAQWKKCEDVAELGIGRCGVSRELCYWAGYAAAREGASKNRTTDFISAQSSYGRSRKRLYDALDAPLSDAGEGVVTERTIYRGLAISIAELEGYAEQEDELGKILSTWRALSNDSLTVFDREIDRLSRAHPMLMFRVRRGFAGLR